MYAYGVLGRIFMVKSGFSVYLMKSFFEFE